MSLLAAKADRPAAANVLRKRLKQLVDHAIDLGLRDDNPVTSVKPYRVEGDGFHTWDEGEISRFFEVHRPGTVAHLATTLMLYTGAARTDAVELGWKNIEKERIAYRRKKTRRSGGVLISIPMHPDLAAALDTCPRTSFTFLQTAQGRVRSSNGLSNLMRRWCAEADLPDCTSHGLRKACARRLAEAGATAHEIASVTGHKTLSEVQRYTERADREGLANAAISKLTGSNQEQNLTNHPNRFATEPLKRKEK